MTAGMQILIRSGLLGAVDLSGVAWVDVDTPIDRDQAGRLFGSKGPFRG